MAAAAPESPIRGSVQVSRASEFDATLASETASAAGQPVYAVFVGAKKDGTADSWCPDCVVAEPFVVAAMASRSDGARVLWCPVLRSEYRGNPDFPYRTHDKIKLTGVPTVVKYVNGEVKGRCVDDECHSKDKLTSLLAA